MSDGYLSITVWENDKQLHYTSWYDYYADGWTDTELFDDGEIEVKVAHRLSPCPGLTRVWNYHFAHYREWNNMLLGNSSLYIGTIYSGE